MPARGTPFTAVLTRLAGPGGAKRAQLAKDDLAPVLEARPEVSHELCRALARRQAAGQLIASADIDKNVPPRRVAAWFSDRLHRLFDLAKVE